MVSLPRLVGLFPLVTVTFGQPAKPPRFEDYPITGIYKGPVKPPHIGDPKQYSAVDLHCLGADSADYSYAKVRSNFAGHFVVESCTCGSGCSYLYMWDALNGKLYYSNFPSMPIDVGPYGDADNPVQIIYAGEEYRPDSSLLILEGCVEDTCDCGRRYYHWNGKQFKLVFREPVRMPPRCLK